MKKIIIIPTYNEKDNIVGILDSIMALDNDYDVLIVDDSSPDGTGDIVRGMMSKYPERIKLEERAGKQGLGTAYILGFKKSIEWGYDYIFEMDADFSHNPKDLDRLYARAEEGYDMVIGSRYVQGGKVKNWPLQRIFISYGASVYTRMITQIPVKDCTAGFICYSRKALESINLDDVRFVGYAFQIEMKYRVWKKGLKISEIPITFVDRTHGESKMSKGIVQEGVIGVWKMRGFEL